MCIRDRRKERIRPAKPEKENKPAPEKREVVTVTGDTRITDVNLDKFNEKYTELASCLLYTSPFWSG